MKILLYLTGRPGLKRTIDLVRHLVKMTGATLTLMVSTRKDRDVKSLEQVFARARQHLHDVPVETRLRVGKFKEVVTGELGGQEFDLLVLGYGQLSPRRRRQLAVLLRDSMPQIRTDILVVKVASPTLERVLICTSGARSGADAVTSGAWYTSAVGAQATLLHVTSAVPSMYTGLEGLDETLPKLLDSATPLAEELRLESGILEDQEVSAELKLRHGIVADEILREAAVGKYDLIVLGATTQEGFMRGFLMGDVGRQILERAEASVLVISHAGRSSTLPQTGSGS